MYPISAIVYEKTLGERLERQQKMGIFCTKVSK